MKLLVPLKTIIFLSLLFAVVTTASIVNTENYTVTDQISDNNTTSTIPSETTDNTSTVFGDAPMEQASQGEESIRIDWQQLLISFSVRFFFIFLLIIALLGLLFLQFVNSNELRKFINTSLRLSNFDHKIGLMGRTWEISNKVHMKLSGWIEKKIVVSLPKFEHYQQYGFHPSNDKVETVFRLEQLQLNLQIIKMYMDENRGN